MLTFNWFSHVMDYISRPINTNKHVLINQIKKSVIILLITNMFDIVLSWALLNFGFEAIELNPIVKYLMLGSDFWVSILMFVKACFILVVFIFYLYLIHRNKMTQYTMDALKIITFLYVFWSSFMFIQLVVTALLLWGVW